MSTSGKSAYASSLSLEYALLGLLSQQPGHGDNLHQRLINDLGRVWYISQSQTYNILKSLEAQGYLLVEQQSQEKLPARRLLRLTESGRTRFEAWLQATNGSSVRAIRVEFTTRLYFALQRDLFWRLCWCGSCCTRSNKRLPVLGADQLDGIAT